MDNYILINNQKIELTEDQVQQIITANSAESAPLSSFPEGSTVKIGGHEMVVLEHTGEATVLIRKELLPDRQFGSNNNYVGSYVEEDCNEFAEEIAKLVGEDNMLMIDVDLTADDGLKDYGHVQRKAALLTADQYRRYVEILDQHKPGNWWWLVTPFSTPAHDPDNWVKCVSPSGCVGNNCGYYDYGVRPFCILKSDIFVSN